MCIKTETNKRAKKDTVLKQHCISLQDVYEASRRISSMTHKTPVVTSESMNELCGDGRSLFFKVEAFQRTGSFKFRGALNAILSLVESKSLQEKDINVVTHSSGNHAAALSLSAKLASESNNVNIKATVVMPETAPQIKIEGVKKYGGEIFLCENTNEAREDTADRLVKELQATFIHSSQNENIIAGQGTTCLEFIEQVKELARCDFDAVIIPVGGGGLVAGNTIVLRGLLGQKVKIILAEPERLDDTKRSMEAGKLLGHRVGNKLSSVADGLKTTLGPYTWPILRDLVDDVITISEDDILRATKLAWDQLKICIEPNAGICVAVAMGAEFRERYPAEDGIKNIGIILSGGNTDVIKLTKQMESIGLQTS